MWLCFASRLGFVMFFPTLMLSVLAVILLCEKRKFGVAYKSPQVADVKLPLNAIFMPIAIIISITWVFCPLSIFWPGGSAFLPLAARLVPQVCMVVAIMVLRHRHRLSLRDIGLRRLTRRTFGLSIVCILLLLPLRIVLARLTIVLDHVLSDLWSTTGGQDAVAKSSGDAFFLATAVGTLVLAALVAPVLEEVLFRGIVFNGLRAHWGGWVAALVSSLLFALGHDPAKMPATFVAGLIFTLFYTQSGSIIPSILAHAAGNILLTLYYVFASGLL